MEELLFFTGTAVLASSLLIVLYAGKRRLLSFMVTMASLIIVLALTVVSLTIRQAILPSELSTDIVSQTMFLIVLVDALIAVAGFSDPSLEYRYPHGVLILVLSSILGLMGIAWSGSLLMLFSSWMLFSVSSYALIAIPRDKYSASGAAKYGLMSLTATNLLLLSIGIIVASQRSYQLSSTMPLARSVAIGVLALLLASIGFKIGVFPFHAWLPDTYGLSDPLPVSLVAPLSKTAAILALYKLSTLLIQGTDGLWLTLIGAMAILTMTYGNITALLQPTLQGLLAYSSIAQAGYLLIGVASLSLQHGEAYQYAVYGLTLQLLAYSLAKTGLFLLARTIRRSGEKPPALKNLNGLGRLNPSLAASAAILTLSLMGMPPLAGFWGKLYLFLAPASQAPWLTALALLNTGIAAAYYARLIKAIYFEQGEARPLYPSTITAVKILAMLTVLAGVIPFFIQP